MSAPTDKSEKPSRFVANLDVESRWQRLLFRLQTPPQLGPRVLDLISAYGTLLRAWIEEGETVTLWTPAHVARERLTPILPVPRLASGVEPRPAAAALAWGWTRETDARVNHRRFAFELARELGIGLTGACWVESLGEVREAVAPMDRWVAKAPFSAAGRDRVFGSGSPEPQVERRMRNLLSRNDGLLVEPWKERVDDFGVLLSVSEGATRVESLHRQVVGETGGFVGIDWPLDDDSWDERLRSTAQAVGEALRREGYRGPASVDAWTWRRDDGSIALNPLGEINARLSFGWVARQIGLRLGRERVRLRLGSGREMAERPAGRVEPLLLPDARGHGAAWLEI